MPSNGGLSCMAADRLASLRCHCAVNDLLPLSPALCYEGSKGIALPHRYKSP